MVGDVFVCGVCGCGCVIVVVVVLYEGKWLSGLRRQTVNLLALCRRRFESCLSHVLWWLLLCCGCCVW